MNPVTASILALLLGAVCFASRRWALLAMVAGVFFLTQGQSIDLAGLNLYPVRFLSAAAFARVLARGELKWSRLNRIDRTLLLLYNYTALIWILRSPSVSAQQFAYAWDATACYLAFRGLIRGIDDVRTFLNTFVILLVPYTALVMLERLTGRGAFVILGNTDPLYIRNGIPRCMGSFRHAILLGSVAASFIPLYLGLWRAKSKRFAAAGGILLCLILVMLSNSGGPVTSAASALLGWALWSLRKRMRLVRRSIVAGLIFLIFFMKAPIWYLPFKISAIVGGGGFHRGALMDHAWQDLGRWWLVGMEMQDTIQWFPYTLSVVGGADLTNQFLVYGIKAGLAAVVISVLLLVFAFKGIGRALATVRLSGSGGRSTELFLWGFGVTLSVHIVSWLGVSYYDQSWVIWLMHLAAISASVHAINASSRGCATPAAGDPDEATHQPETSEELLETCQPS